MATATFHSFRGKKSALILLRESDWSFEMTPVYVPKEKCIGLEKGALIEIPDGFRIVPIIDIETGKPRTAEDGSILNTLIFRKN